MPVTTCPCNTSNGNNVTVIIVVTIIMEEIRESSGYPTVKKIYRIANTDGN